MKTRRREIARVGIFGSKDDPQIVTEKDLKEIAETFPDIKKAPVSLHGHWPDPSSPRLGNVVAVSYDDGSQTLWGDIEEEDALAEAVTSGFYAEVSIGARQRASDGRMYLHHLAYLGEEPPAIKDLVGDIKAGLGIAAADGGQGRVFPSPSDKQMYLSDTPTTKNFINKDKDESPASGAEDAPCPGASSGAAGSGADSAQKNKEASMTEEEAKKLREENEQLKADNEAKELLLSDAEKQRKAAGRERLKTAMAGKIPAVQQDKAFALYDALDTGKAIELSDTASPGVLRKAVLPDLFMEILEALPLPVEPGVLNLSDGTVEPGPAVSGVKFSHI